LNGADKYTCTVDHKRGLIGSPVSLEDVGRKVPKLVESGVQGFNVTVPHKTFVISMMKRMDESAIPAGVVNTVLVNPDGFAR